MGTIISSVESIDQVWFDNIRKGQVMDVDKAVRLDEGRVLLRLRNGKFCVAGGRHTLNGKWAIMGFGTDDPSRAVLRALQRLGVVTGQDIREHLRAVGQRARDRARQSNLETLQRVCEELGVPVPEIPEVSEERPARRRLSMSRTESNLLIYLRPEDAQLLAGGEVGENLRVDVQLSDGALRVFPIQGGVDADTRGIRVYEASTTSVHQYNAVWSNDRLRCAGVNPADIPPFPLHHPRRMMQRDDNSIQIALPEVEKT